MAVPQAGWMVYFMENANLKCRMNRGYPHLWTPPVPFCFFFPISVHTITSLHIHMAGPSDVCQGTGWCNPWYIWGWHFGYRHTTCGLIHVADGIGMQDILIRNITIRTWGKVWGA